MAPADAVSAALGPGHHTETRRDMLRITSTLISTRTNIAPASLGVLLVLAATSLLSSAIAAQERDVGSARWLRLGDLYSSVRRESPRAEAARALAKAAEARIPSSRLPPDP